jgi:hypothetical protein
MLQIIEHRAETSVDFAMEGEAASSTPQVPNRPVSGTADVHAAWQRTAAQASRTPSRATPGALSWSTALVVAATTGGQGDRNKRPRPQRGNSGSCPVHPNGRHNAAECREIIDLAKRVSERREQSSKDGSPPRR